MTKEEEKKQLIPKEELNSTLQSEKLKNDTLLKENKYEEATKGYTELINKINEIGKNYLDLNEIEKESIIKEFLVPSFSNLCFMQMKKKEWNQAIKYAKSVLKFDEKNIKALYRKCVAEIKISDFENAEKDIINLKTVIPGSTELRTLESMFEENKQKESLKEMKKYKAMMNCYRKMNEEKEYNDKSAFGKFCANCNKGLKRIFCCCNKRSVVKRKIN